MDDLLLPAEMRTLLRVPSFTVYRIGRENLIPGATVRIGRFMRFRRAVVEEWIRTGGTIRDASDHEPVGAA